VAALESWIDRQAAEQKPFAVLGDFNRDLLREPPGNTLLGELDDADPPDSDLVNTAAGQIFQNCKQSQTFSGYIDYIVLGRRLARELVADSFGRALFRPSDAVRRKLSDHCPVFIRIGVADGTHGTA
jgi:endonuclease/exonuclease/phosphatase family metal-dependent hydrolase